jgi:hypothetical protein
MKKDILDNIRGNFCCPYKHCKNEKRYRTGDMLRLHLIKNGFMEDYRYWNKHGVGGLNEAEMRYLYLEREVPTDVEEDHDNVNEPYILGFTDGDIEFQVHNIEKMVRNVERHNDDDQYNNGELVKYKKMTEDSKKSFYHGCVTRYTRLFAMVKFFQLMNGVIVVLRTCSHSLRTCYPKAMQSLRPFMR